MSAGLRRSTACCVRSFVTRTEWVAILFRGLLLAVALTSTGMAQSRIRDLVDRELPVPAALADARCSDAAFLRRVSLDLNGMPPSADAARAFLADGSADKRERLVDQLLDSPLYARHIATAIDVMLMERRANTHVGQDVWMTWLVESVREDRPWNEIVREILLADGDDPNHRAPARFYLDRDSEPNLIARDLGRMFFGMDLQCAQCHDSPLVADYLQPDYYGLLSFVAPGTAVVKQQGDAKLTVYAERAGSDLSFESVFNQGVPRRIGPQIPGDAIIDEPYYEPGDEYAVPPADGVRSVPKFSRREQLARRATSGSNAAFNRNAANRFWAIVFGRGLVDPPDMIHSDNSSPGFALLDTLAARFAEDGFLIRPFLRELVLTRAYQRPFELPEPLGASAPEGDAGPGNGSPSSSGSDGGPAASGEAADPLQQALQVASERCNAAGAEYDSVEEEYAPLAAEFEAARKVFADARGKHDAARSAADAALAELEARRALHQAVQETLAPLARASQQLTTNAELAALLEELSRRHSAIAGEMAALETAWQEKEAAVAPLVDPLASARANLTAVRDRLQPVRDRLRAASDTWAATRLELQRHQMLVACGEQTRELNADFAALQSSERELMAATREVAEFEQQITSLRDQLARIDAELQAAAEQQGVLSAEVTAGSQKLAAIRGQQQVARNVTEQLQQATDSLTQLQAVAASTETGDSAAASTATAAVTTALQHWISRSEHFNETAESQSADLGRVQEQLTASENRAAELTQERSAIATRLDELQPQLAARRERQVLLHQQIAAAEESVTAKLATAFAVSPLKPLTPEQLCWSIFRVTTIYERYAAVERGELEKTDPLGDAPDAAAVRRRQIDIEQRTWDKLKGNLATFIQLYGGAAGQPQGDFYASADQALFAANGGAIISWLQPAGDNPVERALRASDPQTAAEELYLGILTRMPTPEEVDEIRRLLEAAGDRGQACQAIAWGLLTSAEFRFNH